MESSAIFQFNGVAEQLPKKTLKTDIGALIR
jgi:hypothetical protein